MLMVSSSLLWDLLGVTFVFAKMLLHLCSVFFDLQHHVTPEVTIYRDFNVCKILFSLLLLKLYLSSSRSGMSLTD